MKAMKTLAKWAAAITAIAGVVFLVIKYFDKIQTWLAKFCPCCSLEPDFVTDDELFDSDLSASDSTVSEVLSQDDPADESSENSVTETSDSDAPIADEADFDD